MCYETACHRSFLILQHPNTGISPRSINSTKTMCREEGHRCDSATERSKSGFGSCSVTHCALRLNLLTESLRTQPHAANWDDELLPTVLSVPPGYVTRLLHASLGVLAAASLFPTRNSKAILAGQLRTTSHLPSAEGTVSHRLHPHKAPPQTGPRPLTEERDYTLP